MRLLSVITLALALLLGLACNLTDPLTLLGCQFRIDGTEDFSVTGIELDNLGSLDPFQVAEVVATWASGSCPVDFTLNVGIFNPNDGSSGSTIIPVELSSFIWELYLDTESGINFDTTWVASGALNQPFEVPAGGESVSLPLEISFDAFVLLEQLGPLEFIDLALAVGGIDSGIRDPEHLGRVLVIAEPTLSTPIGDYTYPGRLYINLDRLD